MKSTINHPEESLSIIQEMIAKSRKTFHRNSFYFILWGVFMFIAGLSEFFLIRANFEMFWIGWPILGTLGGIISAVYSSRQSAKDAGQTFTDQTIGYVWLTYGISLICMIFTGILVDVNPGTLVMLLTGLPTFLTGTIIRHKPLIFGGIVFWIGGLLSLFTEPQYVPLIFSTAILLGYLYPGFTLLSAEKNQNV